MALHVHKIKKDILHFWKCITVYSTIYPLRILSPNFSKGFTLTQHMNYLHIFNVKKDT